MAKFDLKKYLKEGKLHKNKKTLNESCPGYDDRGFGDPLSQSEEDEEIEHEEESEGDDATEILDDVEELELDISNSTVNINLGEEIQKETIVLSDPPLEIEEEDHSMFNASVLTLSNGQTLEVDVIELMDNLVDNLDESAMKLWIEFKDKMENR
jgi:hypothetical protein